MVNRILIIEENDNNLKLFSTILNVNGYETLGAKTGSDGIRLAISEKPNLILMDLQMPDMDGFEILKNIKSEASLKDIPLIALFPFARETDKSRFRKLGFADCIAKPFVLHDFIKTIGEHLNCGP